MLSQNYPTDYLNFKNCFFRSSSVVKISYKGKWIYSGYGITFDGTGSWSFQ